MLPATPVTLIPTLPDLGWDPEWAAALAASPYPDLTPARVARANLGASTVLAASGAHRATTGRDLRVAVGDWVTLRPGPTSGDRPSVASVLPRRSAFRRAPQGAATKEQVVAANIDTVFVVNALDARLSIHRIERYLVLAWQSGADPVVLLTKADVGQPGRLAESVAAVETVALNVPVHLVSAKTGVGIEQLAPYLTAGRTVALLGLSGAGKSTLVNLLVGSDALATGEVGADGQGRHTTTHRQLVPLPDGGLLLDTPGMRAVALWDAAAGVRQAFSDVETLVNQCRFSDCSHTVEPGCAVMKAVADGGLGRDRFDSWRKLETEQRVQAGHQVAHQRAEARKQSKADLKAARARFRD
jgi:ribosome biogenesis GTPase / thiamine phosphate phosphatase